MPYPKQLRSEVKSIIAEHVKDWSTDSVHVPFSGDFAVERLLSPLGRRLYGADDNPLSNATGAYFGGAPVRLALRPDVGERYAFLGSRLGTDADRLATAIVATWLMPFVQPDDKKDRNAYYDKVAGAYRSQWGRLVDATAAKLEKLPLKLAGYHMGMDPGWLAGAGENTGVVLNALPPTDRKLAVRASMELGRLFDVDFAGGEAYTDDLLAEMAEAAMQKAAWLIVSQDEIEGGGIEGFLVAKVKPTNRAATTYVYARGDRRRVVAPCQRTAKGQRFDKLGPGEELTGALSIAEISQQTFFALRSQYMNKGIRPGKPTRAYGVFCGGKLVGAYAMDTSGGKMKWERHISTPAVYMMSDFPVEPVDYDKLAKLVLVAALSKESKLLVERMTKRRAKSVITSAFSKNPVSMKYRGLFKLLIRKENKILEERSWAKEADNDYYRRPFALEYGAELGRWTLEEGLAMWKKKYGQRFGKKEAEQ